MAMEVSHEFIAYARELTANGCFNKAFDLYLSVMERNAHLKNLFEPEIRNVIIKMNELLAASGKIDEIFSNFGRAIQAFPGNIYLMNEIGKYLFKFGFYHEASIQFQNALREDSGFVNAEKNLNSVKNMLVDRWHFRMLNDKMRNDYYRAAIQEILVPMKDTVLDLGTGTGLLAMYATECIPVCVTAVDSSELMIQMTDYILEENNFHRDIVTVHNTITDLNYRHIGGKRSLLVTEMFDAGLFGEHILQSLCHSWQYLLNNRARVLPHKGEFYVMGAKCDRLWEKYQMNNAANALLEIPDVNVHVYINNETYDCEDVHLYQDIKYMTEPQLVIAVDFNNYEEMDNMLKNPEVYNINFKALEDGEINIVIGWFKLHLTENYTLNSDPRSKRRSNAWQQAVFFDDIPKAVKKDDTIRASFFLDDGKLTMLTDNQNPVMRVSPDLLRFVNDTEYMKMITGSLGMACVYLGQTTEMCDLRIFDLCPFPLFGLMMLKRGAQFLMCCAKTDYDKDFIDKVFQANKIDTSKVNILVGEDWTQELFNKEKYHAVFSNILEVGGDIDQRHKDMAQYLKENHLASGGLFMPARVTLMGQIINSRWLDINNRVNDKNVGLKVAEYINKYQVSQNFSLDLTNLQYTALTEAIPLGNFTTGIVADVISLPVIQDGEANAIICWYNIELMEDVGEITTHRPRSFVDGMAFLADPTLPMIVGELANIIICVDSDGLFKLVADIEDM